MLRTEALASIALSAPVVLVVNLGLGSWFVHSGWVSPIDVLTSSLVAMVIPVSLTTIGFGMQARREAAAAAARLIALRSEEHTSELQSLMRISYAVFCLKKKTQHTTSTT